MACSHPLVAYADTGDRLGVRLRPGNVHRAKDVRSLIPTLLSRVRALDRRVWPRTDCSYPNGRLRAWTPERGGTFITRHLSNPVLHELGKCWPDRTVAGWRRAPSADGRLRQATHAFWYRPKTWTRQVRVVAVLVERDHARGELLHHQFFLATNAARPVAGSDDLPKRYPARAEAEQRIGELLMDIAATVCSAAPSREGSVAHERPVGVAENKVSLILGTLAFNLLHALRHQLDPLAAGTMSFRRLRERLLKTAATVTRHARQVTVRINPARAVPWSVLRAHLPTPVPRAEGATA